MVCTLQVFCTPRVRLTIASSNSANHGGAVITQRCPAIHRPFPGLPRQFSRLSSPKRPVGTREDRARSVQAQVISTQATQAARTALGHAILISERAHILQTESPRGSPHERPLSQMPVSSPFRRIARAIQPDPKSEVIVQVTRDRPLPLHPAKRSALLVSHRHLASGQASRPISVTTSPLRPNTPIGVCFSGSRFK